MSEPLDSTGTRGSFFGRIPRIGWFAIAAAVAIAIAGMVIAVNVSNSGGSAGAPGPSDSPVPTATIEPTISTPTSSPITLPTPAPTIPPGEVTPIPEATTPLQGTGAVDENVFFTVTNVEAVQGEAVGPGEVAGPSVRFTVVAANNTGASVNLGNTVLNAYYGDDETPASPLSGPGVQAFPTALEPGRQVTGVYVFSIPTDQRGAVRLTVDYSVETPILVFEGPAPA
ncbi:MAG: hypothetical protein JWP66_1884 [Naasia sp.]|nr:hypothetical protein [Naasia sp.]